MSSKYQQPFNIPEGFPQVVKALTKEVLREQPEDIIQFAADYFKQQLEERQQQADMQQPK